MAERSRDDFLYVPHPYEDAKVDATLDDLLDASNRLSKKSAEEYSDEDVERAYMIHQTLGMTGLQDDGLVGDHKYDKVHDAHWDYVLAARDGYIEPDSGQEAEYIVEKYRLANYPEEDET